jgi:hypothetical protein
MKTKLEASVCLEKNACIKLYFIIFQENKN